MRVILSTTPDDDYLFFLPIVTWCWNKIGVGVELFMPMSGMGEKSKLIGQYVRGFNFENSVCHPFSCHPDKEATYAQCSRLFGGSLDHIHDEEVLITSDIDMLVFKLPEYRGGFTIIGADLVSSGQYPICYILATKKQWEIAFEIKGRSYIECLDDLLGNENCLHMRGNLWARDQETAFKKISLTQDINLVNRSNGQNQFATHRVDRTDAYWRDRVSSELVDAHLWRPGYEPNNLSNIMELMQMVYPYEDFKWLFDYSEQYKKLL